MTIKTYVLDRRKVGRMKYSSIRAHLQPFSIYAKRSTTINHAFASAIAPHDDYDDGMIAEAMRNLGQDPTGALMCAYCDDRPAETWDHVTGLVKDKRYAGHGHTLANLLPCCSRCNSQKGGKDWHDFLVTLLPDPARRAAKVAHLEGYLARYGREAYGHDDIARLMPEEMRELAAIQARILELMRDADAVARTIRAGVKHHLHERRGPAGIA